MTATCLTRADSPRYGHSCANGSESERSRSSIDSEFLFPSMSVPISFPRSKDTARNRCPVHRCVVSCPKRRRILCRLGRRTLRVAAMTTSPRFVVRSLRRKAAPMAVRPVLSSTASGLRRGSRQMLEHAQLPQGTVGHGVWRGRGEEEGKGKGAEAKGVAMCGCCGGWCGGQAIRP